MSFLRLRAISAGHMEMDLEMMLSYHPNHALTRSQRQRPRTWFRCPSFVFIIEHPKGRILVDTSINPAWEREWRHPVWNELIAVDMSPEEALEARLQQYGLGPDDFRYVVITHLHSDHAGNLRLFQEAGAEIIVHEDEMRGALTMERGEHLWGPGSGFGFVNRDYAFLPRKATTVYGDQELVPGVRLLSLPGHTWGTMGVMVNLEHTGRLIIPSDAIYHHESYGPPAVGSVSTLVPEAWHHSMEKLRRLAHRTDATVVPGHDYTTLEHRQGQVSFSQLHLSPDHVYE